MEMEMVGEFNQAEFTWTNDECFAPLPFSPDGTAKRRRHSTVHVHARQLSLPVFLCGKGSKGGAVTAVVFGFCKFLRRSTRWRLTQFVATCARDLVVVIRFLRIFARVFNFIATREDLMI